jgi:hypothetical protein
MTTTCVHEPKPAGRVAVVACAGCGAVEWFAEGRPLDPGMGLAAAFGNFDLVGSLPAIAAPGAEVLMYRPADRRDRQAFAAFPPRVWLEAQPGLWLSHDGHFLLLAPADRSLVGSAGGA